MSTPDHSTQSGAQNNAPAQPAGRRYWDGRFVVTNLILVLLAGVAAYLEYSVYQSIMTQPLFGLTNGTGPTGFGEKDVTLSLSFLTFRYDATRCYQTICTRLIGVPSLDFFQIFVLAIIVINVVHFVNLRRAGQA